MADPKKADKKFELHPGLAASAALVVAVLAAVGVAGDMLTRAVRNEPSQIAVVVSLALLAVGLPIVAMSKGWIIRLSVLSLLGILIGAVILGARSVSDREQPRVALSAVGEQARVKVVVEASGSSLRTSDDMLVQILGLRTFSELDAMGPECERSRISDPPSDDVGSLLAWERAGPDSSGGVELSIELDVPVGEYDGICAWAALRKDPSGTRADRATVAYLRLVVA